MNRLPEPASQAPVDTDAEAPQLNLLRLLATRPVMSQRELSHLLGLSLGKTHYLLHALLDKGLVKVRNFRRSDNKMAYAYLLTPAGVREKMEMTRDFLSHKEVEFEQLRMTIAALRSEVADSSSDAS